MPDNKELCHVRSLTVFGGRVRNFWLLAPSLLTLDLQNCWNLDDRDLPHIEKMFLLKYLSLRSGKITKLPKNIEQLQNIETLDLKFTWLQELPSSVARLQRLARLYVDSDTRFPDGIIGQMRSLEYLDEFGISSCEEAKCLQEFSQLTNLRTLKVHCRPFDAPDSIYEERRNREELYSSVGTLISSETLHYLYLRGEYDASVFHAPMSLESWCHVTRCSLRKLRLSLLSINKVPKWMSLPGNLRELELSIFRMEPEGVAILGAMPVLLFLTLSTIHGTDGWILIRGFASLKYCKLKLLTCGTALEFQAGAMPKLEHLELELPVHHRLICLSGFSDFGIRHLLALTKLEVVVRSAVEVDTPDLNEEAVSLIKTLIGTLCISPVITLSRLASSWVCISMGKYIESLVNEAENSGRSEQNCDAFDMPNLRVLLEEEEEEEKYSATAGEGEEESSTKGGGQEE